MKTDTFVACDGLDIAQAQDLEGQLKRRQAHPKKEVPADQPHGDAVLFTVLVAISPVVAGVIAAFILRPRKDVGSTYSYKFRRIEPNGAATECEIAVTRREIETKELSSKSIEAIARLTGLKSDQVISALQAELRGGA